MQRQRGRLREDPVVTYLTAIIVTVVLACAFFKGACDE